MDRLMLRFPRLLVPAAVALTVAFAPSAMATPTDVVTDYADNGVLDKAHSMSDLNAALAYIQNSQQASYAAFEDVITEARNERLLGLHRDRSSGGATPAKAPVVPRKGRIASNQRGPKATSKPQISDKQIPTIVIPATPAAIPSPSEGSLPWPFMGLSILAGLLVMAGTGSTIVRRVGRRR
jgi:hypothetical protein